MFYNQYYIFSGSNIGLEEVEKNLEKIKARGSDQNMTTQRFDFCKMTYFWKQVNGRPEF